MILFTHHEDVDMLNELIYSRMTKDECTESVYYSTDKTNCPDAAHAEMYDVTV